MYGARFADQIENAGTLQALEKSRLVIQGSKDRNHGLITYAPTVLRILKHILICIVGMFLTLNVFVRD